MKAIWVIIIIANAFSLVITTRARNNARNKQYEDEDEEVFGTGRYWMVLPGGKAIPFDNFAKLEKHILTKANSRGNTKTRNVQKEERGKDIRTTFRSPVNDEENYDDDDPYEDYFNTNHESKQDESLEDRDPDVLDGFLDSEDKEPHVFQRDEDKPKSPDSSNEEKIDDLYNQPVLKDIENPDHTTVSKEEPKPKQLNTTAAFNVNDFILRLLTLNKAGQIAGKGNKSETSNEDPQVVKNEGKAEVFPIETTTAVTKSETQVTNGFNDVVQPIITPNYRVLGPFFQINATEYTTSQPVLPLIREAHAIDPVVNAGPSLYPDPNSKGFIETKIEAKPEVLQTTVENVTEIPYWALSEDNLRTHAISGLVQQIIRLVYEHRLEAPKPSLTGTYSSYSAPLTFGSIPPAIGNVDPANNNNPSPEYRIHHQDIQTTTPAPVYPDANNPYHSYPDAYSTSTPNYYSTEHYPTADEYSSTPIPDYHHTSTPYYPPYDYSSAPHYDPSQQYNYDYYSTSTHAPTYPAFPHHYSHHDYPEPSTESYSYEYSTPTHPAYPTTIAPSPVYPANNNVNYHHVYHHATTTARPPVYHPAPFNPAQQHLHQRPASPSASAYTNTNHHHTNRNPAQDGQYHHQRPPSSVASNYWPWTGFNVGSEHQQHQPARQHYHAPNTQLGRPIHLQHRAKRTTD